MKALFSKACVWRVVPNNRYQAWSQVRFVVRQQKQQKVTWARFLDFVRQASKVLLQG